MTDERWAIIRDQYAKVLGCVWRISFAIGLRDADGVLRAIGELRGALQPISLAAEEIRDGRSETR